ncbi:hypothetical protein NQZ68_033195 [Dissostichus eleginoides]|nr:hypothetical protein NQZ68_033195 [Dissostichus eleginoides]
MESISSLEESCGRCRKANEHVHIPAILLFTLIIIIVAVAVLTISVTLLVRRNLRNREQGIYSVPTEQDQKGTV